MGVPLLWGEIGEAAQYNTLLGLSMEAFTKQPRVRAVRLGCDASIWLFHARKMETPGEEVGINADLRVLLFRLFALLRNAILPFFVFDGPNKPKWKRGNRVAGGWKDGKDKPFKELLDLMGMPWRTAPGEAEAELAACAKRGEIDGVLTDDVDTLLFGAPLVVRNTLHSASSSAAPSTSQAPRSPTKPSSQLPSSSQSQPAVPIHAEAHKCFYSEVVAAETGLEVSDLIFCALMSGGDYATGMLNVGIKTAVGLSLCGFGAQLVDGIEEHKGDTKELERFIKEWRKEVVAELKTNSQGKLSTRKHKLAQELEADTEFPDLKIVNYYTHPAVSMHAAPPSWDAEPNIPDLIPFLSTTFEWSNAEVDMYCRNLLYPGLAMSALRKSALLLDSTIPRALPTTTSAFFDSISDLKTSSSTKNLPCYRVQLSEHHFSTLITAHLPSPDPFPIPSDPEKQVLGRRVKKVEEAKGTTPWRHWIPQELVESDERGRVLVREWERQEEKKKGKGNGLMSGWVGSSKEGVASGARSKKGKSKGNAEDSDATVASTDKEDRVIPAPRPSKSKTKLVTRAPPHRRPLSTASTSAASTDTEDESDRAPPPPKSSRKSKQQQSPIKKKSVKAQTAYLEISSDEDDLLSPNKLGRLGFPSATGSTSATAAAAKVYSSHSYVPPSPAPSRNTSSNRPLASSSASTANRHKASSQITRKGLLSFSSTKVTTDKISRTGSNKSGSGSAKTSQSRPLSIDLSASEEEEELLLSLDEALKKSREVREKSLSGGAVERGKMKSKDKAREDSAPKERGMVEELVLSDSE